MLLMEPQAESLAELVDAREQLRQARETFMHAVRRCRDAHTPEYEIQLAIARDSVSRGESEAWAIVDLFTAAEVR